MFKVTPVGRSRLDVELSGKLDSADMKAALDDLVEKSAGIESGRMLYDVIDFHMPSLGAIAIEFSRLPSMLGLMGRFERAAVLADESWIRKISELEGVLYPGLEIKAFSHQQRAEAEAWLESEA